MNDLNKTTARHPGRSLLFLGWLILVLFGVGVLAVGGWAGEKSSPPASAKPEDMGKDKKPAFRAGAVRVSGQGRGPLGDVPHETPGIQGGEAIRRGGGLRQRLEREPHSLAQWSQEFRFAALA
jgi:hypothetical protein